jgi:hypothetical protein
MISSEERKEVQAAQRARKTRGSADVFTSVILYSAYTVIVLAVVLVVWGTIFSVGEERAQEQAAAAKMQEGCVPAIKKISPTASINFITAADRHGEWNALPWPGTLKGFYSAREPITDTDLVMTSRWVCAEFEGETYVMLSGDASGLP